MTPAEADRARAPLVLVVEDEPQVRRFLRATLPGHGYRLVEAETGGQGLVEAARVPPTSSSWTWAFPTSTAWR